MADKISVDRIDEILRVVFRELKAMGGLAKPKVLLAAAEAKLNLTDYERERTRTGAVRWDTHVRFFTVDCVKAGFLVKGDGQWSLTEKGEKALTLPAGQLIRTAQREYQAWKKTQVEDVSTEIVEETEDAAERQAVYEQAKEAARAEIDEHIDKLGAYDFQKLVAELLRAMGYHVSFVAPPGRDGGIDIVAYKDPLGTVAPRINVQVKHRDQKVDVRAVRELEGLLRREGDIGLIVSSGGFTKDVEIEIRHSNKHIETMDFDRLVSLWQQHYDHISEAGRDLLPLVKVFFLKPAEE
jgi:restriction system protein